MTVKQTLSVDLTIAPVESTDLQCTPLWLAELLGYWDLDPCSNPFSHIRAGRTCSLEGGTDGLRDLWTRDRLLESVFVNPPYSDPLPWCERLAQHNAPWCALLKLDPTTKWYRASVGCGSWWAPFRKRIKFESAGNTGTAKWASMLVWRDWWPRKELLELLWEPRRER